MAIGKQSLVWMRVGCLAGTVAALFLVFRRLSLHALAEAFHELRPGWFVAAVLAYGLVFLPAAWRWHLALRMTGVAVHPGATARLTLIGHFFYTILFGAIGGDTAKSALYARWYRVPFPQVLAAAPLDRFLGFAGLLIFASIAFVMGSAAGAFSGSMTMAFRRPSPWLLLVLAAVPFFLLVLRRTRFSAGWRRFWHSFLDAVRRLRHSGRTALSGVVCGFLVQLGLSAVLALNLQAVTAEPLPLVHVMWTFPVIIVLSALPISFAGLGVREGAALVLLALYGVSPAAAVDASLLTLSAALFWALVGALLLFWEDERQRKKQRPLPATISAVIPTLNEAEALEETVRRARQVFEIREIIVVDGGSVDATREVGRSLGCRVLESPAGRGGQMRIGARAATGDVILLLHADTWLSSGCGRAIINCFRDSVAVAGGFWKVFRQARPCLRGARLRCALRLFLGRRILGDQAIFVRREVLETIGGVPDMPLMEEFELCGKLRRVGRLALADATVSTSARRFARLGVARTYFRMWWVTLRYRLGTSPQELRRLYEKK
jgi:rSAM/selenodomain-associated transferase 2